MNQIVGLANIKSFIDDAYADWGYGNAPAGEKERFADMSGIESAYGRANYESGNGLVFGTWQVAGNLAQTMLERLEGGDYSSTIPKDVQTEMAEEYRAILAQEGSHKAALQNQRGGLIMAMAIQADNNNTLKNNGIDAHAVEDAFPDHKFALTYVKHQLPPKEVKAIYAELDAVRKGEKTMEQALRTDINSLVPLNIQASNPSTYNKKVDNLGQVRVENLGEFLQLLDNKQQLEVRTAAAQTGVTMPTTNSLDYVIRDIESFNPELAEKLRNVQPFFDARTEDPKEQQQIADAFNALTEQTKKLFEEQGIIYDEKSSIMATHIGAYSAAAILKADGETLLSDVSVSFKDGKQLSVNMQNVQEYVDQLETIGIQSGKNAEEMTVADFKSLSERHLEYVKQQADEVVQERQNGTQSEEQSQEFDFFAGLQEAMGPEFGALVGFVLSIASLIGNAFGLGGEEMQSEDVSQDDVAASNTLSKNKENSSIVM